MCLVETLIYKNSYWSVEKNDWVTLNTGSKWIL